MGRISAVQLELPLSETALVSLKPWSLRMEVLRIKVGLDKTQMAKALGVSKVHYYKMATGERSPNLTLRHLVVALELSDEILARFIFVLGAKP